VGTSKWVISHDTNFVEEVPGCLHEDLSDADDKSECIITECDHKTNNESDKETGADAVSHGDSKHSIQGYTGQKHFYGKNRYNWSATEPSKNVHTPQHTTRFFRFPVCSLQQY